MSIWVSDFHAPANKWNVVHDDALDGSHQGVVVPASIPYSLNNDGTANYTSMVLTCPVCGATSTHPVGGGAQAESVQEMFIRRSMTLGCPCPSRMTPGRPFILARSHIRSHSEKMEFVGRWSVPDSLVS